MDTKTEYKIAPEIMLSNGEYYNFLHPERSIYSIEVIASALSKICRFTGHIKRFYSVAEHSVYVSRLCAPDDALEGLLHDAHEAFVGDMSSPLKVAIPAYKDMERFAERELRARFNLAHTMPDSVRVADKRALAKESALLQPPHAPWPYLDGVEIPLGDPFLGREPEAARVLFLERYEELTKDV